MNTWSTQKNCYQASLDVDFPVTIAPNFVYCANETMVAPNTEPCLKPCYGNNGEATSYGVIVIGDQHSDFYVLAGALTAHRSQSIFHAVRRGMRFARIDVEQPYIKPDETPEEILVLKGNDWRQLLFDYAEAAARKNGVAPIKADRNMTGYCTWYYYYKDVTGQDLLDNIKALSENRDLYAAEYVQIDDGYQSLQGDWLERDKDWPFTLESAAQNIIDKGMKAGIWLMPFSASTASQTYQNHQSWFVRHPKTGEIITNLGWTAPPDHLWACLDATNPEVREHITHIFKTFRQMGYTYFKLDGLDFGLTDGLRYDPDSTPVSAFRLMLKTIREAVPDAIVLACTEPFLACLGLCDNARASCDTARYWMQDQGVKNNNYPQACVGIANAVHQTMSNFWMFDRWFRMDPDSLMARQDNAFYTFGEARISVLSGIASGVVLTSDRLDTIAPERLRLLGKAQQYRMRDCRPFLNSPMGKWPQFFEGTVDGRRAVAVINDSLEPLPCNFAELGLPDICDEILTESIISKYIELPPHDAALFVAR